jgi:tRNA/tmRNA/rRNA uracil-C5-methylase (TrmA/RlmC/RlmD family)
MTAPATGDTVEVGIERIAYGGDGVGHADGLVVFVPRTAPGDRVRTRIVERHPRYARGRLEAVVDAGPARVSPGCPVYGACGGCQLQHLDREAQLESKLDARSPMSCGASPRRGRGTGDVGRRSPGDDSPTA